MTAHAAVKLVADAIVRHKTHIIDLDLKAYFDNVRHGRLLAKVAARVNDDDVMHLLKVILTLNFDPKYSPLDVYNVNNVF